MESKHTPGPWYVHDSVSNHYRTKEQVGTYDIRTAPLGCHDNGIWIGDVKPYGGDGFTNKETAKANAYLIAAAPDLLEALQLALPYIEGAYECAFPDSDHNENVLTQAREAIAKATGQPITCENR